MDLKPIFELTKDPRLVRVVQQYYKAPLNPNILSAASSVTVVPLNSVSVLKGDTKGSTTCSYSAGQTSLSHVITHQDSEVQVIEPRHSDDNHSLQISSVEELTMDRSENHRIDNSSEGKNFHILKQDDQSFSTSNILTHKVYKRLLPKSAFAKNVKAVDTNVKKNQSDSGLVRTELPIPKPESTGSIERADKPKSPSSTTLSAGEDLAEYCLVDCNDGEFALMPTSSKMQYAYETPKNRAFSEMWQLPNDMCRVCAKRSDNTENIFSDKSEKVRILDMIHNHLPIMVSREDVLPLTVCRTCISSLQIADKLVKTCVAADKTLRTLLEHVCKISLGGTDSYRGNENGHSNILAESQGNKTTDHIQTLKEMPIIEESATVLYQENVIFNNGCHNGVAVNDHTYVSTSNPSLLRVQDKLPLSQLLSEKDITAIKEMKAEGLKVTLVRLPKLSNLSEKSKHNTVLEVLKTLKTNPALKKMKKTNSKVVVVAGSTISSVTTTATNMMGSQIDSGVMIEENKRFKSPAAAVTNDGSAISSGTGSEFGNDVLPDTGSNWVEELGIFDSVLNTKSNAPQTSSEYNSSRSTANFSDGSITIASCTFTKEEKDEIRNKVLAAHATKLLRKKMKGNKKDPAYKEKMHQLIQEKLEKIKQLDAKSIMLFHCNDCDFACDNKEDLAMHKMSHYQCKFCDKPFKTRVNLIEHERVHTKEKPFVCEQCGMKFRTKQQMREHAQRHNPEKPYQCEICDRRFSVRTTYKAHVQRHNTETPYLCELCGKSFKLQSGLRFHKLTHRTFNCTICNKSFSYRALQLHKKTHSGEGFFPCSVCGKQFLSNQRLKIHSIIHEGTYPYCCGVCHRSFKRMTHLQAHRKRHISQLLVGILYYKCAVCNESFDDGGKLSSHVQSHSSDERLSTKAFKCSKCSKCFSEELELQSHEQEHSEVRRFSCGICKQFFDCREELDQHASDHSEERPFACDVCGKRFEKLVNLNNHKTVHLSAKPFNCEVCMKPFKTVNGLSQHKMVHSDIRKYSCLLCKLSFKRRDALKNHERTHFTERPYTCSVCARSFKVKSDCTTHLRRHRMSGIEGSVIETYYNCPACSEIFTLKVDLTNHVRDSHDLDVSMLSIDEDNDSILSEDALVSQ